MNLQEVMPEELSMLDTKKVSLLHFSEYDHFLVQLSGGKDSLASLFTLLDQGVPASKIELCHQSVDGGENDLDFMDWACTESYCQAVGDLLGIPVSFQWRSGGFHGELMRKDSLTGDVYFQNSDGRIVHLPTKNGKANTRRKFPALAADLRTRWCSAYMKIDVFRRALNNDKRFEGKKILVITGERREESPARSRYNETEAHVCDSRKRLVHSWRPVIDWTEQKIWDAYEKRRFAPHPAYLLGWNRTSCLGCIFSTPDLWAMMRELFPDRFYQLVEKEKELGFTIDPKFTLEEKAKLGSLARLPKDPRIREWVKIALSRNYSASDLIVDRWEIPAGAFRGSAGGAI